MSNPPGDIASWLQEDGYEVSDKVPAPDNMDWALQSEVGNVTVSIFSPTAAPHIVIQVGMQLSPDHQKAYDDLPKDAKEAFKNTIRMRMVMELPDFDMRESEGKFRVTINRILYPDDLTRQGFMDSVRKVHHLGTAISFIAQDFLRDREGVGKWR